MLIKGTADFFALNAYSAFLIENQEYPPDVDWNYMTDQRMKTTSDPSWQRGTFHFSLIHFISLHSDC